MAIEIELVLEVLDLFSVGFLSLGCQVVLLLKAGQTRVEVVQGMRLGATGMPLRLAAVVVLLQLEVQSGYRKVGNGSRQGGGH